ncbi:MAG: hypothetical protein ACHQ50_09590 [Fimbriimonadales bacterium]
MLETPLFGRFLGENKYLIFAPAKEYLLLVGACVAGGLACTVYGMAGQSFYFICLGLAVLGAGIWGAASLHWISFNLRERVYTRRQGPGLFPRTTRGSLNDLEVIFLLAEQRLIAGHVTYRLLLQWRGHKEPPMVLQQDYRAIPQGQPLNFAAGSLYHLGAKAANVLGIPIADHAHVSSPNPVPMGLR